MATLFVGDYLLDSVKYEKFSKIVELTRSEFDALETKDEDTLYVITDENPAFATEEYVNSQVETINTEIDTINIEIDTVNTEIDTINTEIDSLKTSVSEGKSLIAAAVTDKGVETAADDTFAVMAANISNIPTGTSYAGTLVHSQAFEYMMGLYGIKSIYKNHLT